MLWLQAPPCGTASNMSELSLAAALFGCQPAPGHAAPNQGVPTAWVLLFVKKHACEEVYAGLFTASKGTRVWVLQNAQLAWLRLYADDDHDPAAWLAELVRHRAVLAIRGSLPTIVGIFCNDSPSSRAACSVIPTVFYGHSAVILDLDLISLAQERCAAVPALLEVVAMAAPQLRGLRFTTQHIYTLPPPTLLPQLRTLYLTLSASEQQQTVHSLVRSCAAYLPQLTSLALCESEEHQPLDWPQLFNPASTSTTLRTFQCGSCLDDKLLDLLLQHTPALEQLYVDSISLRTDYSEQQWAVTLLFNEPNDSSDSQDCQGLLHLPTCSKGPTVILIGKLEFTIDTPQVRAIAHAPERHTAPCCALV